LRWSRRIEARGSGTGLLRRGEIYIASTSDFITTLSRSTAEEKTEEKAQMKEVLREPRSMVRVILE